MGCPVEIRDFRCRKKCEAVPVGCVAIAGQRSYEDIFIPDRCDLSGFLGHLDIHHQFHHQCLVNGGGINDGYLCLSEDFTDHSDR